MKAQEIISESKCKELEQLRKQLVFVAYEKEDKEFDEGLEAFGNAF